MEITELLKKRRELQSRLASLLLAEVGNFTCTSGVGIERIHVNMVEVTTMGDLIGDLGRRYVVGTVDVDLAL